MAQPRHNIKIVGHGMREPRIRRWPFRWPSLGWPDWAGFLLLALIAAWIVTLLLSWFWDSLERHGGV